MYFVTVCTYYQTKIYWNAFRVIIWQFVTWSLFCKWQ